VFVKYFKCSAHSVLLNVLEESIILWKMPYRSVVEKHSIAMLNMIRRRKAALCPHMSLCNVYLFSNFDHARAFVPLVYADTNRLRNSVCATPICPL